MLKRIHQKLGTAGFAIAIVALIAALGGTALAASGALSGKQKKEVEKIAKKFAGKPGAPGATGTAGTNGTNGKDGAPGAPGKDGTSVTGTTFAGNEHGCSEGGVEFKGANTTYACNGEKGATGFTERLPSGKTETGTYAFGPMSPGSSAYAPISFNIPLAEPLDEAHVHYVTLEQIEQQTAPAACAGTGGAPEAEKGNLCFYEGTRIGTFFRIFRPSKGVPKKGADSSGATAAFVAGGPEEAISGTGTWAVTAP